ncbi:hypothetical protein N0V82_001268 [Gnomoniopsis sp. IMI 355080]|nr:hypothetical protein N0V82_001268 [Gnomoniopsis sp. IMI 355080]
MEGSGRVQSCMPLLQSLHAHPDRKLYPHHAAHIVLPNALIGIGSTRRRTLEMDSFIKAVFPPEFPVQNIWYQGACTQIVFEKLPPEPWPISVGGSIAFLRETGSQEGITGSSENIMFPGGERNSWTRNPILSEIDGRKDITTRRKFKDVAIKVYNFFRKNLPNYHLTHVLFTVQKCFLLFVSEEVVLCELPGSIAGCFTYYYPDTMIPRPSTKDLMMKRSKKPLPEARPPIIDNTIYATLRPGVLLCTADVETPKKATEGPRMDIEAENDEEIHYAFNCSTTGVLVYHNSNPSKVYMTGSRHSMSEGDRHVWQPGEDMEETFDNDANRFGTFNKNRDITFPGTDVCLVNINDGVAFENIPFQNDDGAIPPLKDLVTPDDDFGNMVTFPLWLNSPYTGTLDGMLAAFGLAKNIMKKEGRSSEQAAMSAQTLKNQTGVDIDRELIETTWMYHRTTAVAKIAKGMCGSAIVDGAGVVQGFYHAYCSEGPLKGLSYTVGAQFLAEKGYRLAPGNGAHPGS